MIHDFVGSRSIRFVPGMITLGTSVTCVQRTVDVLACARIVLPNTTVQYNFLHTGRISHYTVGLSQIWSFRTTVRQQFSNTLRLKVRQLAFLLKTSHLDAKIDISHAYKQMHHFASV